jgi:hypothetical protein
MAVRHNGQPAVDRVRPGHRRMAREGYMMSQRQHNTQKIMRKSCNHRHIGRRQGFFLGFWASNRVAERVLLRVPDSQT